ncbi:MAG: DUF3280 domain-containing protein [Pseudomonadota bacterium]
MLKPLLGALALTALFSGSTLAEPRQAAFFGIHFINTSMQNQSEEEAARLKAVEDRLVTALAESGQYSMIDISPVADDAAFYENLAFCNGCDTDLAKELGADVAITGEIQKTSNLILSMSLYIRDAETGALVAGGSADMRGNTDQSWFRTTDWLLRNRVLRQ